MDHQKERRFLERIRIDGAEIAFRTVRDSGLFGRYSEPMPVEDLTWNSIRFLTSQDLKPGDKIDLELIIPGENRIQFKGYLIWSAFDDRLRSQHAVVQLLPFGTGKQYNSMKVRDRLKKLVDKYRSMAN